jgi:hypothetical protein
MKNKYVRLLLLALSGASAVFGVKVMTDYNHAVDFSQYHTYSWVKVEAGDPLWPDRITHAVDSELSAKGWSMVPAGGDASVAAFGSTLSQPRLETFYTGFGGGWFWRGWSDGMAYTTVEQISIGTLVLDRFDSPTKKLIWRGIASDTLSDKPEKNEEKLDKAVEDMFKHFPPKPKG